MYDNLKERLTDMSVLASTRTPADALQYIEELEVKLAEEIRISNLRGNMIEFQLLPDLHDAQAKLAKAVEALRYYAQDDDGGWLANTTLTELTGGKDE